DELLHHANVHFGKIAAEGVVETALRQAHVERHLAALEALDGHARTALLALLAAAAGLALARADAPAHADTAMTGASVVADVVEFHCPALALADLRANEGPFSLCPEAQRASHPGNPR